MKVAILDDWFDTLRTLPCFRKLDGFDVRVFTDHVTDETVLADRLLPFEAITLFRERTAITASLLEKLPNLKVISQRSVYPHVDVDACTQNGVLLCSDMHAGAASYAAAEHTWALILAAARSLPQQMESLRAGHWQIGVGKTLRGRTLGLYGYGRIARVVAEYANTFGMQVVWWASEQGRERAVADGETVAASREAFFSNCDFISLHVRLKPTTKGLITNKDLSMMKPDATLINTSRAGLIEQNALLTALNAGRPGLAAIDVFDKEPITWADDPLATHPNLIGTPHIGFVTEDEIELQFSDIFDQVRAYHQGKPINMINPEVLG